MSTNLIWTTACGECGKRGPEAETSPEAKRLAAGEGWSIGARLHDGTRSQDYCPSCRFMHDRVRCNHKSGHVQCASDSRYRLSRGGSLYTQEEIARALGALGITPGPVLERLGRRIKDSSEWWACGKHLPVFTRDLFNATPEPVLLVRVA